MNQSVANDPLLGLKVLVTRPIDQQPSFNLLLVAAGALPINFPCLEIHSLAELAKAQLADLDQYQCIIFTSQNAVKYAAEALPMPWPNRSTENKREILAVGPSTATALATAGIPVTLEPQPPYNSESLLRLKPLTSDYAGAIAIVKGAGGRRLLAEQLIDAGFSITDINVYERRKPHYSAEKLSAVFLSSRPDIVTITSNESLSNLSALAGDRFAEQLRQLPLVVNSERGANQAVELGFRRSYIFVASVPGDQGQLDAIRQWKQSYGFKL